MMYAQQGRSLVVTTPLGPDAFLLTGVAGREAVSEGFSFQLDLLSESHDVRPEALIGRAIAFDMRMADGRMRRVHGRVGRFAVGWTTPENLRAYQIEVVPWFWFLRSSTDCRVYQNLSVPEIASHIFEQFGFSDFDFSFLREPHPKREYSVQYQESYHDYLCRLFEEEGIFFFFRHEEDRHVLVLADTNAVFRDGPESDLPYDPADNVPAAVRSWFHRYAFHPIRFATGDYNHEAPGAPLQVDRSTLMGQLPRANLEKYEHYQWPGGYQTRAAGDTLVLRRLQEMEVGFHVINGSSVCPGFAAGTRFTLAGHPDAAEQGKRYVLLAVEHEAEDTSLLTRNGGTPYRYQNRFTVFPMHSVVSGMDKQYRPQRRTAKPVVNGTQTAVVVGPPGERIHCDEQGRVKVQFHWDRHGPKDDGSSCWVRVSQSWAGAGYGAVQLPHVGQEVLVSFLDGDPDRPVIVGRLYNADNRNPLVSAALERRTQTIMRDHGGNHILTEGRAGAQRISIHAVSARTVVDIGIMPRPHPSGKVMAQFQAAFAEAGAALHAKVGAAKAAAQARLTPPAPSPAPSQSDIDAANAAFWTSTAGDTIQETGGDVWSVTDQDSYTLTNGASYTVVQGDTYTSTNANAYSWVHGEAISTTYGNSVSTTHGNESSTVFGETTGYIYGNQCAITCGGTEYLYLGELLNINVLLTQNFQLGAVLNVNVAASATFNLLSADFTLSNSSNVASEMEFTLNKLGVSAAEEDVKMSQLASVLEAINANMQELKSSINKLEETDINISMGLTSLTDQVMSVNSAFRLDM